MLTIKANLNSQDEAVEWMINEGQIQGEQNNEEVRHQPTQHPVIILCEPKTHEFSTWEVEDPKFSNTANTVRML